MNHFSSFHPIITFVYFASVLLIAMFTTHPVVLLCAFIGAVMFFCTTNRLRDIMGNLVYYIFVFIIIAVTNPLFNHNGETVLFFMNDKPMTLEAIIYGGVISFMLIAIIFWCKSLSDIMTSDKILYLFGKTIPKISLLLAMALRYIPTLKNQMQRIQKVQTTMGLYTTESITDRIFSAFRVLNVLIGWSLENSIDQADSMKARGYGLKGRSHFSIFRLEQRDYIFLSINIIILLIILWAFNQGIFTFYYYPVISTLHMGRVQIFTSGLLFLLMALPSILQLKGEIQWKYLRSKV